MGIARLSSAGAQRVSAGARAVLGDDVGTAALEELWENQRRRMTGGYTAEALLESDRAAWTDAAGADLPGVPGGTAHPGEILRLGPRGGVPWIAGGSEGEGWEWRSDWTQDVKRGQTDADGWRYAPRFNPEVAGWSAETSMIRLVRRRRWLRLRVRLADATEPGGGGSGGGGGGAAPAAALPRLPASSSAEDIRALADDVVTPSGATLPQLLGFSPAQLLEVAGELEVVAPQRAAVVAAVPQKEQAGILVLQIGTVRTAPPLSSCSCSSSCSSCSSCSCSCSSCSSSCSSCS